MKRIVKTLVWSLASYGAENWTLLKNEWKWLDALEMWIWRRMKKCLDRPESKRRSVRDAQIETINSENNCKKDKELDWSRDERRVFVEGSHGGQNGGEESAT